MMCFCGDFSGAPINGQGGNQTGCAADNLHLLGGNMLPAGADLGTSV